jgi:hypothetical protein
MTVKQRSTTTVPGSDGKLQLSIDDITGGQVMATLVDSGGLPLAGPISLQPGKPIVFRIAGQRHQLALNELNNALVGEDFATFVISASTGGLSEQEKIERLIAHVESLAGAVFIRNQSEHTPQQAAEHLRAKLAAAGGRIATAEQFIDEVASKSSLSGETYQIRLPDGSLVEAGDHLRKKLKSAE